MIELVLILIIAVIYVIPHKGLIGLTASQKELQDELCKFEVNITEEETDTIIECDDNTAKEFGTFTDLSSMKSGTDFEDIDLKDLY